MASCTFFGPAPHAIRGLAILLLTIAAGCASPSSQDAAIEPPADETPLEAEVGSAAAPGADDALARAAAEEIARDTTAVEALAAQSRENLNAYLRRREDRDRAAEIPGQPVAEVDAVAEAAPTLVSEAPPAPEQVRSKYLALLRERAQAGGFRDALMLTLVEASEASPAIAALAPPQQRTLDCIASAVRNAGETEGDPERAAKALEDAAASLRDGRGARIARVALCTRVDGYGRYEEASRTVFVSGAPIRVIVYTEIEGLGHRETSSGGDSMYSVEVGQDLALWHGGDGSLQWRRPESVITETGRNRRRDFYLVDRVELPRTLGVGTFQLKVTVRDRVSGTADERAIPITVVADSSAAPPR